MDTQVSSITAVGGSSGYKGYKKVKGRKRFILVDVLGLLLKAKTVLGDWSDTDAAMVGLEGLEQTFPRIELVWADQGFKGWEFTAWLKGTVKWKLELTSGISQPGKPDFQRPCPSAPKPIRCCFRGKTGAFYGQENCAKTLGCGADVCVVVEESAVVKEL